MEQPWYRAVWVRCGSSISRSAHEICGMGLSGGQEVFGRLVVFHSQTTSTVNIYNFRVRHNASHAYPVSVNNSRTKCSMRSFVVLEMWTESLHLVVVRCVGTHPAP